MVGKKARADFGDVMKFIIIILALYFILKQLGVIQ